MSGKERRMMTRLKKLVAAAERGDARAQLQLANCCYLGRAVEKDPVRAAYWYRKAAEQGLPHAQFNFGHCCAEGLGVEKDPAQAACWYRKAAEQGHTAAQNNLGICYAEGIGVEKDPVRAAELYRAAAERGLAAAQCNLGDCCMRGCGVEKDMAAAIRWSEKAAKRGDRVAQYNLGAIYDDGDGIPRDPDNARYWLKKSAAAGYREAAERLERMKERAETERLLADTTLPKRTKERVKPDGVAAAVMSGLTALVFAALLRVFFWSLNAAELPALRKIVSFVLIPVLPVVGGIVFIALLGGFSEKLMIPGALVGIAAGCAAMSGYGAPGTMRLVLLTAAGIFAAAAVRAILGRIVRRRK